MKDNKMNFIEIIKVFFGFMESDDNFWKRIKSERKKFKESLSQDDAEYLNSLCFEEQLDFTFKSIDSKDFSLAIAIGVIVSLSAILIDKSGKDIEKFINKIKIKGLNGEEITITEFDTNNAFDLKSGDKHRDYIGHDFNIFKSIPGDFVIAKGKNAGKTLNEIIGVDKDKHIFYDFMKANYSLEGRALDNIFKIIKITSIHMIKDIVTDDGLPLPFSSVDTKFETKITNACGYKNSNRFNDALGNELGHTKLSDVNSCVLVKALINIYLKNVYKDIKISKKAKKALKSQMYIVATSTVITMQLFIMLFGKKEGEKNVVDGGKVNLMLSMSFSSNCKNLIRICNEDNNELLSVYKNRKIIIGAIKMKYPMVEYKYENGKEYYFENDEDNYLDRDKLIKAHKVIIELKKWKEKDLKQINAIFYVEELKIKLAEEKISVEEFRKALVNKLKEFAVENNYSIFDETKAHNKFYKIINDVYREGI